MCTYVISDIHGCYDKLMAMLTEIKFSEQDTLILAGDYMDRGPQSFKVLEWIASKPENVICLRGNHDIEFAENINLLLQFARSSQAPDIASQAPDIASQAPDIASQVPDTDSQASGTPWESNKDALVLYALFSQYIIDKVGENTMFDYYGTIGDLIVNHGVTLGQLEQWRDCVENMPYLYTTEQKGKKIIVVHAGYTQELEEEDMEGHYETLEEFYVYARDDAYMYGGIEHGIIIAGHTPTILEEELPYNEGNVYQSYDEDMDCLFYDIDCGCSYKHKDAKLACIRLEDQSITYV